MARLELPVRDELDREGQGARDHVMGNRGRVEKDAFEEAVKRFGLKGAIDLAMTFGYFAMLTFTLNSFEVDVPEGHDVLSV